MEGLIWELIAHWSLFLFVVHIMMLYFYILLSLMKTIYFVVSIRADNLQQSAHDTSIGHQHIQQVDYYRERLKLLRSRCGLDNNEVSGQTKVSSMVYWYSVFPKYILSIIWPNIKLEILRIWFGYMTKTRQLRIFQSGQCQHLLFIKMLPWQFKRSDFLQYGVIWKRIVSYITWLLSKIQNMINILSSISHVITLHYY